MEACGMTGFRFHDLRHTFRTQGAEAGVPLEVMMAQLGHIDRQTSLDYVHIQQRALERAKQLIEAEQAEVLASIRLREQKPRSGEATSEGLISRRALVGLGASAPNLDSRVDATDAAQRATVVGEVRS